MFTGMPFAENLVSQSGSPGIIFFCIQISVTVYSHSVCFHYICFHYISCITFLALKSLSRFSCRRLPSCAFLRPQLPPLAVFPIQLSLFIYNSTLFLVFWFCSWLYFIYDEILKTYKIGSRFRANVRIVKSRGTSGTRPYQRPPVGMLIRSMMLHIITTRSIQIFLKMGDATKRQIQFLRSMRSPYLGTCVATKNWIYCSAL